MAVSIKHPYKVHLRKEEIIVAGAEILREGVGRDKKCKRSQRIEFWIDCGGNISQVQMCTLTSAVKSQLLRDSQLKNNMTMIFFRRLNLIMVVFLQ